mgnify:CR=1 FL=1
MTRTELTELVIQAQKGDSSALEQIYLLTYNSAFNKIHSSIKNKEDSEDVLQSCYLTVIEKIGDLEEPESFEKWFNRIISNRIKDYNKKKAPVLLDESDYNALSNSPEENSDFIPHEHMERRDNIEVMRKLISELSEKNRRIIEMHYMEGKSVSEIAEELGIRENTVKTRLFNGRNEIKKKAKLSAKKILITILVLILLALATLFAVSGSNEFFSKILYRYHNTYGEFKVDNHYLYDAPETLEELYTLSYLPEGFEFSHSDTAEENGALGFYSEVYRKQNTTISMHQQPLCHIGAFDSENAEIHTEIISGYEVMCVKNQLHSLYMWDNKEYIFNLNISTSDFPHEEVVKIIEGVAPNPENG